MGRGCIHSSGAEKDIPGRGWEMTELEMLLKPQEKQEIAQAEV
jgi:hypothetical protein